MFLSTEPGQTRQAEAFFEGQEILLNWAFLNSGQANVQGSYDYHLRINGETTATWESADLPMGYVDIMDDFPIGSLPVGRHLIQVIADPDAVVSESSRLDNVVQRFITVLPGLAPPHFARHPQNARLDAGDDASFGVVVHSEGPVTYQWQSRRDSAGSWEDLTDGPQVQGANSADLVLLGQTRSMDGLQVRCVASNEYGFMPSDAALLEVEGKAQEVIFAAVADLPYRPEPLWIDVEATSGLPVTLTIADGSAVVQGQALRLLGLGPVAVDASQPGDDIYDPAATVRRTFMVHGEGARVEEPKPVLVAGDITLDFLALKGFRYQVEVTSDLASGWTAWGDPIPGNGELREVTVPGGEGEYRFVRLVLVVD